MLDARETVIYVGKASSLKKRISSYFGRTHTSAKIRSMIGHIHDIEVTVTRNEGEALLLECNLIKQLKPRYNILYRDDKSYPYLYLSSDQEFPRLSFYRGARKGKGRYFGPYPSAGAARQTLNVAQKIFQIRQCDDSFFRNRSRPCLQYQIKRCTAPCVGLIDAADYAETVNHTIMFLEGKNEAVIRLLTGPMQQASDAQDYERAAQYRDQIASLRRVQEQQHISLAQDDLDIIGCSIRADTACIQVFMIRNGRNLGNKTFFPTHTRDADHADVVGAFLAQHYMRSDQYIPHEILLSHAPEDLSLVEEGLSQLAERRVPLSHRLRGNRAKWVKMAAENADMALSRRIAGKQNVRDRIEALRAVCGFDDNPERIECFDISHTGGEATVAACVVFGTEGAIKADYRRFNIEDINPGDDYAAMKQAIERRYTRVRKEEGVLPDLILIDGGRGQVSAASDIMHELQLEHIPLLGVAKGPSRKPGLETLTLSTSRKTFRLTHTSTALHLIQEIRDEAHRFAITGHRRRRGNSRRRSPLENIEGVGIKRRQQLIRHFGGIQGVERAGVEELAKVPGINKNLANKIYNSLHQSS